MGKVPVDLRKNIAANIRNCRRARYPKWGGSRRCAVEFGVSPQQWSQWERGAHMPDEFRMKEIADFFGVSSEYLRRDNRERKIAPPQHFSAVRIDGGIEIPLRIEAERVVYQYKYVMKTERIV